MAEKEKRTTEQLKELQSKSLEEKIQISSARIIEWYETWGGQVAVSFSGGKDSTVLLHLVRRLYPDVIAAFSDTGLEFPELRAFALRQGNVVRVKPEMTFAQVIKKYGYPIISKASSRKVWDLQHPTPNNAVTRHLRITGETGKGTHCPTLKLPDKWIYLQDAPFVVGDHCCDAMKKHPLKKYYKEHNLHPMTGVMTEESERREQRWKMNGCNAFDLKEPISMPMAFWTEQDVLHYIKKYNIEYAPVYGELVEQEDGKLKFTGYQRTGCVFCGFGCHLEKEENRFQQLKVTHPKLHDFCMRGGKYDEEGHWIPEKGLGMDKVLRYIGVETDYFPENITEEDKYLKVPYALEKDSDEEKLKQKVQNRFVKLDKKHIDHTVSYWYDKEERMHMAMLFTVKERNIAEPKEGKAEKP